MSNKTYARTISVPFKCCNKCNHFEPCRSTGTEYGTGKRVDDIFCGHEVLCNDIARQIVSLGPVEVDGTEYEIVVKEKDQSEHEADKERPNYVMTPEEFKKEAIKIQNIKEYQFGDKHRIADDLMEELLESLGYEAGLNIIRKLPRYYT